MEKNSVVLPDASFTPPPKTVVEVLWTCGVFDRVLCAEAGVTPPFRTVFVFPTSQPPTLVRFDIMCRNSCGAP